MSENVFSADETREFVRLLKKIQENGYWIPAAAWQESLRTFARYACELVILDLSKRPKILLIRYKGGTMPSHEGHFHIPGGFGRVDESIEETCSRVSKDELGVDTQFQEVLGVHKWSPEESENGIRPLSLYCLCKPRQQIPISESRRFFSRDELLSLGLDDMITFHPHRAFAEAYLKKLAS